MVARLLKTVKIGDQVHLLLFSTFALRTTKMITQRRALPPPVAGIRLICLWTTTLGMLLGRRATGAMRRAQADPGKTARAAAAPGKRVRAAATLGKSA
jgi:hypothetical protein